MALHGALTRKASNGGNPGYLASVRDLRCHAAFLHDRGAELEIEARLVIAEGARVIYEFELTDDGHLLVSGRAAVALDPSQVR
jgi:predicted hotdog family 3-hydroxylacyl-ACP dehydratase